MDSEDQNNLNTASEQVTKTPKVTYDPGWNDPPKVSYGGSVGQTKFIKKGLLNKRVAFPLSSNSAASPPTSSILATTPPKGNPLLPLPSADSASVGANSSVLSPFISPAPFTACNMPLSSATSTQSTVKPQGEDQEPSLESVMNCFEGAINELVTPENIDKIEVDIRKRLEIMKKMWTEEKLSKAVKQKVVKLAEALQKGEGSLANDIHIGIVVDHTTEVSQWMPGIRKLVHYSMLAAKQAQETSAAETSLTESENVEQTSEEEKSIS